MNLSFFDGSSLSAGDFSHDGKESLVSLPFVPVEEGRHIRARAHAELHSIFVPDVQMPELMRRAPLKSSLYTPEHC